MITRKFPILESSEPGQEGEVLTIPRPVEPGSTGANYRVILYNDEIHSDVEVIEQLVKATDCSYEKAAQITYEVDRKGRGICFRGEREKCHKVTRVLREIRLQCEVDCD